MCVCVCVCVVLTTEGFFEVAIESWPGWDLNPPSYNQLSYQAVSLTRTQSQVCIATPMFHRLFSVRFHFGFVFVSLNIMRYT